LTTPKAPETTLPQTPVDADSVRLYGMYIDGEFTATDGRDLIDSVDPVTNEVWARITRGSVEDVDRAANAAHRAFTEGEWPKFNPSQRGALLRRIGDLVSENADWLAYVEQRDNGKLIAELS